MRFMIIRKADRQTEAGDDQITPETREKERRMREHLREHGRPLKVK